MLRVFSSGLGLTGAIAALVAHMPRIPAPGRPVHRVTSNSKRGRQMNSYGGPRNRSKYAPHIGAKEQERAKRCYMSSTFGISGNPRCAPVMHQAAK